MNTVRNFNKQSNKIGIPNGKRRKNLEIGYWGEQTAKIYLQNKGYRIIEKNYRTKYAEIDLIARDKSILVFVEVRTRKDELFGSPEDSINRDKMRKLTRNAEAYAARKKYTKEYRIDVICIVLNEEKGTRRIDHYENVTG